jgi:hypothetical protein
MLHASASNGLSDIETHIENAPCNRPLKQHFFLQYNVQDFSLKGTQRHGHLAEFGSNVSLFRNESFIGKLSSCSSLTQTSHWLRGQKTRARPNTIYPRSTQHYPVGPLYSDKEVRTIGVWQMFPARGIFSYNGDIHIYLFNGCNGERLCKTDNEEARRRVRRVKRADWGCGSKARKCCGVLPV